MGVKPPYIANMRTSKYVSVQLPMIPPATRTNKNYHTGSEFQKWDPEGYETYVKQARELSMIPFEATGNPATEDDPQLEYSGPQDVRRERVRLGLEQDYDDVGLTGRLEKDGSEDDEEMADEGDGDSESDSSAHDKPKDAAGMSAVRNLTAREEPSLSPELGDPTFAVRIEPGGDSEVEDTMDVGDAPLEDPLEAASAAFDVESVRAVARSTPRAPPTPPMPLPATPARPASSTTAPPRTSHKRGSRTTRQNRSDSEPENDDAPVQRSPRTGSSSEDGSSSPWRGVSPHICLTCCFLRADVLYQLEGTPIGEYRTTRAALEMTERVGVAGDEKSSSDVDMAESGAPAPVGEQSPPDTPTSDAQTSLVSAQEMQANELRERRVRHRGLRRLAVTPIGPSPEPAFPRISEEGAAGSEVQRGLASEGTAGRLRGVLDTLGEFLLRRRRAAQTLGRAEIRSPERVWLASASARAAARSRSTRAISKC